MITKFYDLADIEKCREVRELLAGPAIDFASLQCHVDPQPIYRSFHDSHLGQVFETGLAHASANLSRGAIYVSVMLVVNEVGHCCTVEFQGTSTDYVVTALLQKLLQQPVWYVGHQMFFDLCLLMGCKLRAPEQLWDVAAVERVATLGRVNVKARMQAVSGTQADQIDRKREMKLSVERSLDMLGLAARYGILVGIDSPLMVQSAVYLRQRAQLEEATTRYLQRIEMPWLKDNAALTFQGVRVDVAQQTALLLHAYEDKAALLQRMSDSYGVANPECREDVWQVLTQLGLAELFYSNGSSTEYSLKDSQLEAFQDRHPLIRLLRRYRKVSNLISVQLAVKRNLTAEGRIHPVHVALGTETGRQTCHEPNLLGFDRIQRNLIIPDPGYGIAEIDYAQQEVGIAAGLYQDPQLIATYNSGDVYTQMAQRFYAGRADIEPGAEAWLDTKFRQTYPELRSRMKVVTLAILYGQGAYGLAQRLKITEAEGEAYLQRFFALFPVLAEQQRRVIDLALREGYVELIAGLRIAIDRHPSISRSALSRYARNYPIQGSGAVILKTVGSELRRIYPRYRALILVPMHDALIFQAPQECLAEVIEITRGTMIHTMKAYFPALNPRVDINAGTPGRWVKEGCEHALEDYLQIRPGEMDLP